MKNYTTYLFDVDGTLLNTNELIYSTFLNTCKVYKKIEISREIVNKHIGIPLKSQLEIYLGKLSDSEMDRVLNIHSGYQKEIYKETIEIFPGIIQGLEKLINQGKKIGIVTSRTRDTLDLFLKHTKLFDYFEIICSPEMTKHHKPHPEPVIWTMERLNSTPAETLFIGDATYDIESGSSAGVDTAFVSWSHNNPKDLTINPTYIINSLEDLII